VTLVTACKARVVVVVLALFVSVLGLLGATSFSVYHRVPLSISQPPAAVTIRTDAVPATDDWQVNDDVTPPP